eukprot:2015336-Rhodomonas_salina.2
MGFNRPVTSATRKLGRPPGPRPLRGSSSLPGYRRTTTSTTTSPSHGTEDLSDRAVTAYSFSLEL